MRIKEVKDLLSLCFQKDTDIMHPERERERASKKTKSFTRPNWTPAPKIQNKEKCAAKNKIMHQTKLDYSTQNPRTKRKCTANHKSQ
jgi:hypothetical protein